MTILITASSSKVSDSIHPQINYFLHLLR
jgi:hypothetical protein